MVGRRGSFAPLDIGTELVVASRVADSKLDQGEMLRTVFAPPVKDDDWTPHFAIFFALARPSCGRAHCLPPSDHLDRSETAKVDVVGLGVEFKEAHETARFPERWIDHVESP